MKKLIIPAALAALLSSGTAFAQAVIIDDVTCGVRDANQVFHTLFPAALGGDAVIHAVVTPSGNTKVTCNGTLPPEAALPTKGAVVITGDDVDTNNEEELCGTPLGFTADFTNVVTKNGRVSLTCHINGNSN